MQNILDVDCVRPFKYEWQDLLPKLMSADISHADIPASVDVQIIRLSRPIVLTLHIQLPVEEDKQVLVDMLPLKEANSVHARNQRNVL